MEANFVELISRGTTLEEVQAYVLLRQSTLGSEDKKRILLEHGGNLKYEPVVKSFRLLGSKFFHDFNTGRTSNKTKVYDINFTEKHDGDLQASDGGVEKAYSAMFDDPDPEIDHEFMEIMLSQDDSDALLVNSFEGEFEEFLQETPEMHEALISYIDARARLQEKKKSRGFWPVSTGSSSKGRGRFSRDSKGKGKGGRRKEQLLARIARSHCRKCGALGHWKAECPQNNSSSKDPNSSASANVVSVDALTTCVAEGSEDDVVYVEDGDEDTLSDKPEPDPQVGVSCCRFHRLPTDKSFIYHNDNKNNEESVHVAVAFVTQDRIWTSQNQHFLSQRMRRFVREHVRPPTDQSRNDSKQCHQGSLSRCDENKAHSRVFNFGRRKISDETEKICQDVLQVGEKAPTSAILDTGASRCIIGEKTLSRLRSELPESLLKAIRFRESRVKFRFGNNQTLTSTYQILFPLKCPKDRKRRHLAVEVVPGLTPFLFSKKAFQSLGGVLDTRSDSCILNEIDTHVHLTTNRTGLYLMNIIDICQGDQDFTPSITKSNEEIHNAVHNMFAEGPLSEGVISHNVGNANVSEDLVNHNKPDKPNTHVASIDSKPSASKPDCSHINQCVNHAEPDGCVDPDSGRIHCSSSHVTTSTGDSLVGTRSFGTGRDHARGDSQPVQNMMNEMQVHRRMLEGLIAQQGRGRSEAHQSPGPSEAASSINPGSRAMGSHTTTPQMIQGIPLTPIRGQPPSVIEGWSEEESFIIEETASVTDRVIPVVYQTRSSPMPRNNVTPAPKAHAGPGQPPRSRGMTIQEWGNLVVTWGRKHRGKTFRQVMDEDWGYYTWSQARFGSLPPEHQDFCRFCQVRLEAGP